MTETTSITLSNVTKQFGDVTAVSGIDLEIERGEFVVIVGPSGCGKSTTLRMIAGLESITDGMLRFGDQEMNDVEPHERNVAMVFQNYALYPHMSVRRNMTFGAKAGTDLSDQEIDERVSDAAETLGLEDMLDRRPGQLSGGERQRVAIGRALVRDPEVMLLDEPLSNLDAKLRVEMRTELAELHDELGTTTVYVTHDQNEAMTLGDRVVVMNDGTIQQVDIPQRLYDYPTNRFVAGFIGNPPMNELRGTVSQSGSRVTVTGADESNSGFQIELPNADESLHGDVVFGIRPEDVYRESKADITHPSAIDAEVRVTEPLGNTLLAYCSVANQEFVITMDPHDPVRKGDQIRLVCDPARLHLFDPENGNAIYHSDHAVNSDVRAQQSLIEEQSP